MPIIEDMNYLRKHNPRVFRKYDAQLQHLSVDLHEAKLREEELRSSGKIIEKGTRSMERMK